MVSMTIGNTEPFNRVLDRLIVQDLALALSAVH